MKRSRNPRPPPAVVLFVDDASLLLSGFARSLTSAPYQIWWADSDAKALSILETQDVDVIVSDECMPGGSGTRLLEFVRVRFDRVTMILLTERMQKGEVARTRETLGLYRALTKPITASALGRTIEGALAMRRLLAHPRPSLRRQREHDLIRVAEVADDLLNRQRQQPH